MPTIDDLIASNEREIRSILNGAKAAGRANLTREEDRKASDLLDRREELRAEKAKDGEVDKMFSQTRANTGVARPSYDRVARIGTEHRTYRPDQPGGRTGQAFLNDLVANFINRDVEAGQRLARHIQEERTERPQYFQRAAGTGAFAGLVVPQYLTDMYAPAVAAMRPFADACFHHDLPADGMTVNISRITTATSVALQASENSAVSETNIDDTLLTENVQTAAGQQTLSRQAIDRGTGVEEVVLADLMKRYASTLDSTLINQATTGLAPISTSQTYTNATIDTTAVPTAWKQVPQAQSTIEGNLLAQAAPSHVLMHPRRWNWFTAATGTAWPSFSGSSVPPQSWGAILTSEYGPSVRGVLPSGLKVIVDANISTVCLAQATTGGTQDHIYVVAADECHLWEDPQAPVFIRAEQPAAASLGVLLVAYGYFAYSLRRYTGASVVINGTGLATPSFA